MKKNFVVCGALFMVLVTVLFASCSKDEVLDVYGNYKGTIKYIVWDKAGNTSGNLEQPFEIGIKTNNSLQTGSLNIGMGAEEMILSGMNFTKVTLSRIPDKSQVVYLNRHKVSGIKIVPNTMALDTMSLEINGVFGKDELKVDQFNLCIWSVNNRDTIKVSGTFEGVK